jgi:hypothetical protein
MCESLSLSISPGCFVVSLFRMNLTSLLSPAESESAHRPTGKREEDVRVRGPASKMLSHVRSHVRSTHVPTYYIKCTLLRTLAAEGPAVHHSDASSDPHTRSSSRRDGFVLLAAAASFLRFPVRPSFGTLHVSKESILCDVDALFHASFAHLN